MPERSVFLAAETLAPGNGGICRVARLMARVLAERAARGQIAAEAQSLKDDAAITDLGIDAMPAGGSRRRFVQRNWQAALSHTHFIYDYVGMARAHCLLPGLRRPFLTYMHGIEIWENAESHRLRWARRADVLLANTQYTLDRARKTFGGFERAEVCWLGTETDDPPSTPDQREGPPIVLIVGRLDSYKGHDALIDCWPRIASAVPEAQLWIVGRGPQLEALQQRAASTSTASAIHLKGFVPEAQMPDIWSRASLLAMPSRGEGFGLVYIEAMRYGLPVVASTHDAGQEINLDGVTGCNVDLEKPGELPAHIIELLRDSDRARAMGRAGRQRWQDHFTYSAFRRRFEPILDRFVAM